jgi:hypothetical protein
MASFPQATRPGHRPRGLILLAVAVMVAMAIGGAAYVAYVLWPRWPAAVGLDAPALPITIGGVTFNVPPAAIRVPVQRRPGVQERIDLAFVWPSLQPPEPAAKATSGSAKPLDRLFVTIAASEAMPPLERIKTIYPRYAAKEPESGPQGLAVLPFRTDTPYQGEDLIYDAEVPQRFLLRCSRGKPLTPGVCLHEQRIGSADVTVRFPRDWLEHWRDVAAGIERLVASLSHVSREPANPG